MFQRLLVWIFSFSLMINCSFAVVACEWNTEPDTLLITSFQQAQLYPGEDQSLFQQLQKENHHVVSIFSAKDDNSYALMLINLLQKYPIKSVYVLDPSFANYFTSSDQAESNLIRVFQKYNNVNFYFFNIAIQNKKSISNNIYEFLFNRANVATPTFTNYGTQIAQHFITQLQYNFQNQKLSIFQKYHFLLNVQNQPIVKIGFINDNYNNYQSQLVAEFKATLEQNNSFQFEFNTINIKIPNDIYSNYNVNLVKQAAVNLYNSDQVNFILNVNDWYNNAIAAAAAAVSSLPNFDGQTLEFISSGIGPNNNLWFDKNYLAFGYYLTFDFIEKPILLSDGAFNTYGVNNNLFFTNKVVGNDYE